MGFFQERWERFIGWLRENLRVSSTAYKKRVLVVDDDADFCAYLEKIAHERQIALEKAYSAAEARAKIESTHFDAYIVDGHLPDGSGFYVVENIREKKGAAVPIAFLSRIFQDAMSFRLLKEEMKVNYVLEKPIEMVDVDALLQQLCFIVKEKALPGDLMAGLKGDYERSIFDKLSNLETSILAVQRNPTLEPLQALKMSVHKIAGTAGSYGYVKVGELCKSLEKEVSVKIENLSDQPLSHEWLASLDNFFSQIKKGFQL